MSGVLEYVVRMKTGGAAQLYGHEGQGSAEDDRVGGDVGGKARRTPPIPVATPKRLSEAVLPGSQD